MNSARPSWRYRAWARGGAMLLIPALIYLAWYSPERVAFDGPPDSPMVTGDEFALETDAPAGAVAADEPARMGPDALWTVIDEESVTESPTYKETVQDRALVRIVDVPGGWRVGQRIAVQIPQLNETFTPVIERIQSGPYGVRSYVGTLAMVAGHAHRFTITVGPRNTFAHLSTPSGTYELVATGELGWLMPTINMDQHVDYGVPDYVVPEEPRYFEPVGCTVERRWPHACWRFRISSPGRPRGRGQAMSSRLSVHAVSSPGRDWPR